MGIGLIIAGKDRSNYIDTASSGKGGQTTYTTATSQRGSASVSLRVHEGDTSFAPLVGYPISLYDQAGKRVFGGLIAEIVKTNEGNTQEISYVCTCVSFERMLDKHRIQPQSFFNQTAGAIFTAIFNSLPGETITLGTVEDGPTISSAIYRHEVVTTVFDDLATQAGFVWGVDPQTETLYFRAPTTVTLPFSITGDPSTGAGVLWDTLQWDTAQQDFRSRQYIIVNLQALSPDRDLLTGDGTTTSFPLRFTVDTVVQVVFLGVSASVQGTANGIQSGDTVTVSSVTYSFVASVDNSTANQVLVGADDPSSMQHLREAINAGANAGVDYSTPTVANPDCQAVSAGSSDITVIARLPGSAGNSIPVSDNAGGNRFAWTAATLAGGNDGPLRASVDGSFSALPGAGDTVTVDGTTYTFVATLDNTVPYQVAIGASTDDAAADLVAAITGSPNAGSGAQFSLPTIPHTTCQAAFNGGGGLSVYAKSAGAAGNSIAVSTSSPVFSWSNATLGGGVDGPTTAQASGTTGAQDWYWTEGIAGISSGVPLPAGVVAEVTYYRLGVDIIGVEDSSLAAARAAVEGGSGIYQALIDVASSTDPAASDPAAAIAAANAALTSYGLLTQTLTFYSDSTGWQPGCALNVNLPPPFDTSLNGTWTIQQIDGSYIPGMDGWRVQVQAIAMSTAGRAKSPDARANSVAAIPRKGTWQQFWMRLATVNPRRQRVGGTGVMTSGGAGGGGGGTGGQPAPPAPAVVIDGEQHVLRNNDLWEIDVSFHVPGATAANWAGAAVYVEDPDISGPKTAGTKAPFVQPPRMDGTTKLDGSANMSGMWSPLFSNDATLSPVAVPIPVEGVLRTVRIYLASFGPNSSPVLVRANDTAHTPTPSIAVQLLPQQLTYISGMEYAWLVTDCGVDVNYFLNQVPQQYSFTFHFTPPTAEEEAHLPPGVGPFTGCAIKLDYGAGVDNLMYAGDQKVTADDINAHRVITWTSDPRWNLTNSFDVIVYFVSESDSSLNSVVPGVTPSVKVTVTAPSSPSGGSGLAAPDVTGLQIVGTPSVEYQLDGSMLAIATFQWVLPSDATGLVRYAGMDLYLVATTGSSSVPQLIWSQTSSADTTATVEISRIPSATETWYIAAISVDFNGKLSDDPTNWIAGSPPQAGPGFHSPWTTWTIGPPSPGTIGGGVEYAPLVTLNPHAMATATESTSSDGVRQVSFALTGTGGAWTNPTSNQFGGAWVAMIVNGDTTHPIYWQVPQNATSFTTPNITAPGTFGTQETVDFYILSQDPQGNRNHLVLSVTPKIEILYTPTEGMIIPSRFNPAWFNQSEFVWDPNSNTFTTQSIGANKIQVGSILSVGGKNTFGGSQNGQIGVFDASQNLIGWIGQQQGGQGTSAWSIFGAWFKQLWVGGSAPAYAPLWIDQNGIVEVGGIAALAGAPYPYISIRDAHGIEMGRIGAQLTNPSAPGDGGAPSTLPSGVTAGAWFTQFAAGGSAATNWQIMIGSPPGSFFIRNTDLFQIDYPPNTSTPPYNQEYLIQFGKGVWAGAGLAGSYQFPGFLIYENDGGTPPNIFGSVFINRGMVLRGTATQGHRVIASFDMFNGDSQGSDFPPQFFGELVLYCPTNPAIMSVQLSSGYQNAGVIVGDSGFRMWDRNGHATFSVDGAGDVTATGSMTAGSYNVPGWTGPVIDAQGNWKGNPISASSGVQSINAAGYGPLTGAVVFAGGTNVSVTQVGSTITITSSGSGSGAQTPWTQNIDAHNFALNSPSAIRSYHMDPNSPNYSGTGFQLLDVATGNLPGLAIYQDNGIIVAGAYDSNPATNIQPANFLMSGPVTPYPQRILMQTNLSSQDYPVIGVGFTDANSPGYINLFAYGAQGFFKQTTQLAWEIRNGNKSGGAGTPNAGVLSGDIYLYNTSGGIVFQVSQGSVSCTGTVGAAGFATGGASSYQGTHSVVVRDVTNTYNWTITFTNGILTGAVVGP